VGSEMCIRDRSFEHWDLWVNTNVPEDIAYCNQLAAENHWIFTRTLPNIDTVSNFNIRLFFRFAQDPDAMYVRLDDDIVYLHPGFLNAMFSYREKHPEPFLVYGNIVNNMIVNHINQRNDAFRNDFLIEYASDGPSYFTPAVAEVVHKSFLDDLRSHRVDDKWMHNFREWHLLQYERVSINAVSWLGTDIKELNGHIRELDEEQYLSVTRPGEVQRPCVVIPNALCSHFAFCTQREHLETNCPDILQKYAEISKQL
jgi:hypothetical protein